MQILFKKIVVFFLTGFSKTVINKAALDAPPDYNDINFQGMTQGWYHLPWYTVYIQAKNNGFAYLKTFLDLYFPSSKGNEGMNEWQANELNECMNDQMNEWMNIPTNQPTNQQTNKWTISNKHTNGKNHLNE